MYSPLQIQRRPAAIIGNGPSLRGFDFKSNLTEFDCFGMNAAYRYWDSIEWYPQYYSCLDLVVGISHQEAIGRMIKKAGTYGIRKFLLRGNLVEALGDLGKQGHVYDFEAMQAQGIPLFRPRMVTTGSHTCAWAALLGYRDMVLMGIDSNYVNVIKEARQVEGIVLEIAEAPKDNPNYFFDEYQKKGDRYHVPNHQQEPENATHIVSWRAIRRELDVVDALVVNANPQSLVKTFDKCQFDNALAELSALRDRQLALRQAPGLVGTYAREDGAVMNELVLMESFLPEHNGIMLDVGAMHGSSCLPFLKKGWRAYTFEPDPENRAKLRANTARYPGRVIDERAVSKVSGRQYPWFSSPDSAGISAMLPFDPSHQQTGTVTTVTLRDYCTGMGITHVDFLKIDAEGFDYMVLQGFPFESIKPTCLLCEFEDKKSLPLGSSMHDMARLLVVNGYHLFMSEWHPIIRYGIPHQWRRLIPYPAEPASSSAWGNLLAFREKPDQERLINALQRTVKLGAAIPPAAPGVSGENK